MKKNRWIGRMSYGVDAHGNLHKKSLKKNLLAASKNKEYFSLTKNANMCF